VVFPGWRYLERELVGRRFRVCLVVVDAVFQLYVLILEEGIDVDGRVGDRKKERKKE
jgi:hypothetical protein